MILSGSNITSTMTVSVLFYPVKSIQQIITSRRSSLICPVSDEEPKSKRNSLPWMQQAVSTIDENNYICVFITSVTTSLLSYVLSVSSEIIINSQGYRSCLVGCIQFTFHWKWTNGSDTNTRERSCCERSKWFQRPFL